MRLKEQLYKKEPLMTRQPSVRSLLQECLTLISDMVLRSDFWRTRDGACPLYEYFAQLNTHVILDCVQSQVPLATAS